MPILPLAIVVQLAAANAPQVSSQTVAVFAKAESGLNPLAIHDNATGQTIHPANFDEAVRLANGLLAEGHGIDLGIMQISHRNLAYTGMTVETAFDPARSIRAAATILIDAYKRCRIGRKGEAALRCMASVYNTGSETAGLSRYVPRVWRVADLIVPALRETVSAPVPPQAPPLSPAEEELHDALRIHPRPANTKEKPS